ncbi:MAG: hypothetical protein V1798_04245 [Pseudomonadota bacterium]
MIHSRKTLTFPLVLVLAACSGGGSLDFTQVVNIQPGDAVGQELTGAFSVHADVTSNDCLSTDLEIPAQGAAVSMDVELVQDNGTLAMSGFDVAVRGSVNFFVNDTFEMGGADIVDRGGGVGNILRLMRVRGRFSGVDTFSGSAEEQLTGQIAFQKIDCFLTYQFTDAIRK